MGAAKGGASGSGSSFLDEWLAKRKQLQQKAPASTPAPAPPAQPLPPLKTNPDEERLSKLKSVLGQEEAAKQRDAAAAQLAERRRLEQELAETQKKIKEEKAKAEAAQVLAVRPQPQGADDEFASDDEIFIDLHGNLHHKGEDKP